MSDDFHLFSLHLVLSSLLFGLLFFALNRLAWVLALALSLELFLLHTTWSEVATLTTPAVSLVILEEVDLLLSVELDELLTHASNVDDLLEGLDGVLEDWLNRLHNTKTSFHIIDLWLHTLNSFHFSSNFNKWLTIVESLQNSSSKSLLNILDGGGLGDSSGFIVSRLEIESLLQSGLQIGNEGSVRLSLEGSHVFLMLLNETNTNWSLVMTVVVMVASGNSSDQKCNSGLHFVCY